MWIQLLRHGIAEDPRQGQSDANRALTEDGVRRLRRAGPTWAKLMHPPSIVMTSPLVRARQTADVLLEAIDSQAELRVEDALTPEAAPMLAVTLLEAELLSGTDSVAVVGHQPHLGALLGVLLTGHPRVAVPLKKGMLVGVEVTSSTSLLGELRFALTQKAAARLA